MRKVCRWFLLLGAIIATLVCLFWIENRQDEDIQKSITAPYHHQIEDIHEVMEHVEADLGHGKGVHITDIWYDGNASLIQEDRISGIYGVQDVLIVYVNFQTTQTVPAQWTPYSHYDDYTLVYTKKDGQWKLLEQDV